MKNTWFCIVFCGLVALFGCETMPVTVNSDKPVDTSAGKLQIASEMFSRRDEPVKAEEMIREEIERFKRERNQLGLAEAYRQYGLFFRSNAVDKFEKYYREKGFEDKTVTFDQRYEKAVEYFTKAREIFEDYGHIDTTSNLYISLAKTYDMMNRRQEACTAFDMGLKKYLAYKQLNPEAVELRSEEMQNYEEYIGIMKQQAGCTDGAAAAAGSDKPKQDEPTTQPAPDHTTGTVSGNSDQPKDATPQSTPAETPAP